MYLSLYIEDDIIIKNSAIPNIEIESSRPAAERKNKCGICRSLDHSRHKCPQRGSISISSSSSSSAARPSIHAHKRKIKSEEKNGDIGVESGTDGEKRNKKYKGNAGDNSDSELSGNDQICNHFCAYLKDTVNAEGKRYRPQYTCKRCKKHPIRSICIKCNIPLCIPTERGTVGCFELYHTT